MTRREFLAVGAAAAATASVATSANSHDVTQYVNPFIGTGGHGHTYPGATVPFGMVQLSPDTYNDDWDWCSGYHTSDSSIMGFSHTHLSGTGIGDMLDFLLMPSTHEVKFDPGPRENPDQGYRSRFSHADEAAEPGYYSVTLTDYRIFAELTASERAGFHRYTFPKSDNSHFILDLAHAYGRDTKINWAQLKVINDHTIAGGRSTSAWADGREIYFVMQFSRPFASARIVSDGKPVSLKKATGPNVKAALLFSTDDRDVIQVKTGLSGVSIKGARKNLMAEIPAWDFDAIRKQAKASWQRELGKIDVASDDVVKKQIFYSALYHAFAAPTLFDDVDQTYKGMDGKLHQLPRGVHNYSTFSLWDTYRAGHPLFTLLQPERVADFANCLVRMSQESPAGIPVWPLQAKETGCMTGVHSVVVLAEAAEKGVEGVDYQGFYNGARKRLMEDDYRGLDHYRQYGYLPSDLDDESVSKTLGYAYDDYAAYRLALAAGRPADAVLLKERSKNYRHLFDSTLGFVRPKLRSGDFAGPFDPKQIRISQKWNDFTESNSWQETFANQHDLKAYIELFGGRAAFIEKLDALFNQSSKLPPGMPPDVAGLVGMYAHGNEPSHHVAYLYSYAGVPWKTQARVRSLLETMYHAAPDGMAGNEDCGQMSAWYVFSAIGFYPVDPVSGNYVIGTPLFDRISIDVGKGKRLTVTANRSDRSACYIQSLKINSKTASKLWFHHSSIQPGSTIEFVLADEPNKDLGGTETDLPPTLA